MPKLQTETETETKTKTKTKLKPRGGKKGSKKTGVDSSPAESTSGPSSPGREILYPSPEARIGKMTAEIAQLYMGWLNPIGDEQKKAWAKDRHFEHDLCGPVRFSQNTTNRPIRLGQILLLMQEILRGRWKFNGEPVIIGKTGIVLDGQHTMIALVLAAKAYHAAPDLYPAWKEEPWIEKLVVTGIEEDDATVNTINTGIPRSDADVLYRTYYQDKPTKDRRQLARILAYATRFVWNRTGANEAFALRRTHAETVEFIERHRKLLECSEHLYQENGTENRLQKYLPPGYAAGLMYLMAASSTDDGPDSYREANNPSEELINFDLWQNASNFWVELASGDIRMNAMRERFAEMLDDNQYSMAERIATLIVGWLAYPKIEPEDLRLEYAANDEGVQCLASNPACGGIDLGPAVD